MLAVPETGMGWSVDAHNVDRGKLCDWIEASIVFDSPRITKNDVVDALIENNIYESQDKASEIVTEAWATVSTRVRQLGFPFGIKVEAERMTRERAWDNFPAYSFCLTLACAELFPSWAAKWKGGHNEQGEIFEEITAESLKGLLAGWKIRRVGWSSTSKIKLKDAIDGIIGEINEVAGSELDLHVDSSANELGLDVLAYYPFSDNSAAIPLILFQCASGKNWVDKRHTPDLAIWEAVVSFCSKPVKGFAMPYAFASAADFRKQSRPVGGMFMDRNRLLQSFEGSGDRLPQPLNQRIRDWAAPKLQLLPTDRG